jgi:hypothetical protein
MKKLWEWIRTSVVILRPEKPADKDLKGGAIGWRFWF